MVLPMGPRLKKLIGAFALLIFVGFYFALAAYVTAAVLPGHSGLVQGLGYAFAGLIWIVPAGAIISWMQR